jgi:hypothetical protein
MTSTPTPLTGPSLDHLCSADVYFADVATAVTPTGTRMLFPVSRGTIEGPRLRGEMVPGSIDWVTVGSDGIGRIDVHAMIKTHDDAVVQMTATGRTVLGERAADFLAGEEISGDEAYIRICPLFETSDPRYAWLNEVVTIARCDLSMTRIRYQISVVQ